MYSNMNTLGEVFCDQQLIEEWEIPTYDSYFDEFTLRVAGIGNFSRAKNLFVRDVVSVVPSPRVDDDVFVGETAPAYLADVWFDAIFSTIWDT